MTIKPFSAYPEVRDRLLALCAKVDGGSRDMEEFIEAASALADEVKAILTDERAVDDGTAKDLAEVLEALRPFAERAVRYEPDENDDHESDWSTAAPSIRIGDLRRAAAIVEKHK